MHDPLDGPPLKIIDKPSEHADYYYFKIKLWESGTSSSYSHLISLDPLLKEANIGISWLKWYGSSKYPILFQILQQPAIQDSVQLVKTKKKWTCVHD
jgi:hypothetical protein